MSTTVVAVILGIILVTAIHPGKPGDQGDEVAKVGNHHFDLIRSALLTLGARGRVNLIFLPYPYGLAFLIL